MQHIGIRRGTATDLLKAVEITTEIAAYARDNLGWDLRVGVGHTGNADGIAVFSRNDSLEELLSRRASVMSDPGMRERMASIRDVMQPGSSTNHILRPLFEPTAGGGGDLVYFRAVSLEPNALGAVVETCGQICEHLRSQHGLDVNVSTEIGGPGDTLVWGVRFNDGDAIEAGFEGTMADDAYNALVASTNEHTVSIQDRIVRFLPR